MEKLKEIISLKNALITISIINILLIFYVMGRVFIISDELTKQGYTLIFTNLDNIVLSVITLIFIIYLIILVSLDLYFDKVETRVWLQVSQYKILLNITKVKCEKLERKIKELKKREKKK